MGTDRGDHHPWTPGTLTAAARRVVGTSAPTDPFSVAVLSRTGATAQVQLSARNDSALRELGERDADTAVERLTELVAACDDELGATHPDTLVARGNLAVALLTAGQVRQAVNESLALLADRGRVLGADHPSTINAHLTLGLTHLAAGDPAAACAVLETAVGVLGARRGGPAGRRRPDTRARACSGLLDLARAALDPGAPAVPPATAPVDTPPPSPTPAPADDGGRHRSFPLLSDTILSDASWRPA